MKLIPLNTEGFSTVVDDEDYEMLSGHTWYLNERCNEPGKYYAQTVDPETGDSISMHRMILGLKKGDKRQADHFNGNGLDNLRSNLRIATPQQNAANRCRHRDTESGYKGVSRTDCGAWKVQVCKNYKRHYLGVFATKEDAARAYDAKARELFGEFARTNF